jgi:hypothetical protein
VVDEHCRGGLGDREVVKGERADQAGVEHADATGDRRRVGQIADEVGDDQRGDRGAEAGGREGRPQDGDVEQEIAGGAEQAEARPGQRAPRGRDSHADVVEPGQARVLGRDPAGQLGHAEDEHGDRHRGQHGQAGPQDVVRSRADAEQKH